MSSVDIACIKDPSGCLDRYGDVIGWARETVQDSWSSLAGAIDRKIRDTRNGLVKSIRERKTDVAAAVRLGAGVTFDAKSPTLSRTTGRLKGVSAKVSLKVLYCPVAPPHPSALGTSSEFSRCGDAQASQFVYLGLYMELNHAKPLESIQSSFFLETGSRLRVDLDADLRFDVAGLPAWFPKGVKVNGRATWFGRTPAVPGKPAPPITDTAYEGSMFDTTGKGVAERTSRALRYNRLRAGFDKVHWHTMELSLDLLPDDGHTMRAVLNAEMVLNSPEFRKAAYTIATSLRTLLGTTLNDINTVDKV